MYVDETPVQPKLDMGGAISRDRGMGRPTKRERREMDEFYADRKAGRR
jgi:hypothetical protein